MHYPVAGVVPAELVCSSCVRLQLTVPCRGGGGGTYGIVVEATVRLIEVPVVTLAHLGYRGLEHAVDVFDRLVLQRWQAVYTAVAYPGTC